MCDTGAWFILASCSIDCMENLVSTAPMHSNPQPEIVLKILLKHIIYLTSKRC